MPLGGIIECTHSTRSVVSGKQRELSCDIVWTRVPVVRTDAILRLSDDLQFQLHKNTYRRAFRQTRAK